MRKRVRRDRLRLGNSPWGLVCRRRLVAHRRERHRAEGGEREPGRLVDRDVRKEPTPSQLCSNRVGLSSRAHHHKLAARSQHACNFGHEHRPCFGRLGPCHLEQRAKRRDGKRRHDEIDRGALARERR
eukprot:Amastigsp_a687603_5.p4 type:complete len:128 gc:universal Amastigsp_a687603_5:501-884(+)